VPSRAHRSRGVSIVIAVPRPRPRIDVVIFFTHTPVGTRKRSTDARVGEKKTTRRATTRVAPRREDATSSDAASRDARMRAARHHYVASATTDARTVRRETRERDGCVVDVDASMGCDD